MKLKQNESTYVAPKAGLTHGVITAVIDTGSAPNKFRDDEMQRQLMIEWTLPKQTNEGEPLNISKWFTASIHEKSNLYGLITDLGITIVGEYDLFDLLGVNCMVNITEFTKDNGDKKMNVSSVAPLMEEMEAVTLPTRKLDLNAFSEDDWSQLSEGIQKLIMKSPEYKELTGGM